MRDSVEAYCILRVLVRYYVLTVRCTDDVYDQ